MNLEAIEDEDHLRKYLRGDEQAYAALVRRYIGLVFSSALRQSNGNVHLAEDVTQVVFADLAREAAKISPRVVLGGWLFRRTQYVSSNMRRSKERRERRELAAADMSNEQPRGEKETWEQIAPVLDEAINALPDLDRNALVLRFFEGLSLRQVSIALGFTEEAARKRIHRALEKLRKLLLQRGISSSVASLGVLLGSYALGTAPAALANVITGAAVISTAAATASPLLEGLIMSKVKVGVASALAAVAVGTPLWQQSRVEKRDLEISGLRQQIEAMAQVHSAIANLPVISQDTNELTRLREQHAELMRLRGVVTVQNRDLQALRQRAHSAEAAAEQENVLRRLAEVRNQRLVNSTETVIEPEFVPGDIPVAELNWAGNETPTATARSLLFAIFQNAPESLASLQYFPNSPGGLGEQEELRLARERIAEMRRVWAGVQRIKKFGTAHVRGDKYKAIFSFDYGPGGQPEGAPAGGDLTLRKIGKEFRIEGYGWRQHD